MRHARHVVAVVENVSFGEDHRLKKQVDDLLGAGYRVSVITMRHPANDEHRHRPGLRLLEYAAPRQPTRAAGYTVEYSVSLGWALLYLVRLRLRGRIDVLHLAQPPDIYFPVGWLLRRTGTRVVVDQRDLMTHLLRERYDDPPRWLITVLGWLQRRTAGAADHVLTVNEYLRDALVASGVRPERISIVRNGPVLARVDSATAATRHPGGEGHSVVWIGKMGPQDRVDLLLEVADEVVNRRGRRDVSWSILGDGECLEALRARAEELGLVGHVSLPGWLSEAEVFARLAVADVGVDTSMQEEVSPVKVLEYMAFGLPTVCFDLPETRRIGAGAAELVPPGDLDGLCDGLLDLLDDPARRHVLGERGRQRLREELAWDRQADVYLAAVRSAEG